MEVEGIGGMGRVALIVSSCGVEMTPGWDEAIRCGVLLCNNGRPGCVFDVLGIDQGYFWCER